MITTSRLWIIDDQKHLGDIIQRYIADAGLGGKHDPLRIPQQNKGHPITLTARFPIYAIASV